MNGISVWQGGKTSRADILELSMSLLPKAIFSPTEIHGSMQLEKQLDTSDSKQISDGSACLIRKDMRSNYSQRRL